MWVDVLCLLRFVAWVRWFAGCFVLGVGFGLLFGLLIVIMFGLEVVAMVWCYCCYGLVCLWFGWFGFRGWFAVLLFVLVG